MLTWPVARLAVVIAHNQPFTDGVIVRVIENGVVHIKAFSAQSEAAAFAQSERARLGVAQISTPCLTDS